MCIFSNYFHGEYQVSFANLKGTEFGNVIDVAKKEQENCKYRVVTKKQRELERLIQLQLPKKFGEDILSMRIIPSDITGLMSAERKRGNYVSRKECYDQLLDFMLQEMTFKWKKLTFDSAEYVQARKWREVAVLRLKEEIDSRLVQAETERWEREKEKIFKEIEASTEVDKKKRQVWLEEREKRIKQDAELLDDDIFTMVNDKFEEERQVSEAKEILSKLERVLLNHMVHEALEKDKRSKQFWSIAVFEEREVCYVVVDTDTLKIDFKIVDPYHICMIHEIMKEGGKAFSHSYVNDKSWQVILYILELDPSPDIEIHVSYFDLFKSRKIDFEAIREQIEWEMENEY